MADKNQTSGDTIDEDTKNIETELADFSGDIELSDKSQTKAEESDDRSDEANEPLESKQPNVFKRFWAKYKAKSKIAIPLTIVALLLILLAIPMTRYAVVGMVMKKDVILYTVDSQSKAIVYNSSLTIDGKKPGCGPSRPPYPNCFSKVQVGKHKLKVEASNYKTVETDVMVGIGKPKEQKVEVLMTATGREVSFRISNKINGKALGDVRLKAGDSETLTDKQGNGSIVVDPSLSSIEVEISSNGYNTLKTKIEVHNNEANFSQLSITPVGKIYFLSKKTGKIDVVKTDLDGGNRQTVLAGTGQEEDTNTVLLASRDWKYLALLSRRDSDKAKLYLIDTSTDKMSEMDSGDATFTHVGWNDHFFIYKVYRDKALAWQPKASALKTYNAENQQLNVLDESNAEGSGDSDYAADSIDSVYILNGSLVYAKHWNAGYYSIYRLSGKRMGIYSIKANGTNKQTIKDFDVGNNGYINAVLSKPTEIYYSVTAGTTSYYEYGDGKISETKDLSPDAFYKFYPTYLASPSGQKAFWYEPRDGKNTLLTGTPEASNPTEISTLSEYTPYGWYSDDYLLVSKTGSELFVLPAAGPGDKGQILKISDYHKPTVNFAGYGGGYGGL